MGEGKGGMSNTASGAWRQDGVTWENVQRERGRGPRADPGYAIRYAQKEEESAKGAREEHPKMRREPQKVLPEGRGR